MAKQHKPLTQQGDGGTGSSRKEAKKIIGYPFPSLSLKQRAAMDGIEKGETNIEGYD